MRTNPKTVRTAHPTLKLILLTVWCFFAATFSCLANEITSNEPQLFTLKEVEKNCIELSQIKVDPIEGKASDCQITDFGSIGSIQGEKFYYAIYCLAPRTDKSQEIDEDNKCDSFTAIPYQNVALILFIQEKNSKFLKIWMERVDSALGTVHYYPPEVIKNKHGQFLFLPLYRNGEKNISEYYLWQNSEWQLIDHRSWINTLPQHIPDDLHLKGEPLLDIEDLSAISSLYRSEDEPCCPSANAYIGLELIEKELVLKSVEIDFNIYEEEEDKDSEKPQ